MYHMVILKTVSLQGTVDLIPMRPLLQGTVTRPDSIVSFIEWFHCTTRDSRPDPNVSFIQRFHCIVH